MTHVAAICSQACLTYMKGDEPHMLTCHLPLRSLYHLFSAHAQNVVLISIASVMDASLAPAGKHTLHAYLPATEPFHLWEGRPTRGFNERLIRRILCSSGLERQTVSRCS